MQQTVTYQNMSHHTLPKQSRMRQKVDFTTLFKQGKAISTHQFVFLYRHNTLHYPRFAVSIKAKRFNNIVCRNQCQRWLKECFRRSKDQLTDIDVIVLSRKNISFKRPLTYQEIQAQWQNFLSRLK